MVSEKKTTYRVSIHNDDGGRMSVPLILSHGSVVVAVG
jgi:hypothetical protein